MLARELLRLAAENNAWANHRLHTAVARLDEPSYRAPRVGFFPSIHATLVHILLVDMYYVDGLTQGGRGQAVFDLVESFTTFSAIRLTQCKVDEQLIEYVASAAPTATFEHLVQLPRHDHVQHEPASLVLMHLFQHQIHHRGQVHNMLCDTSVSPPQLDEFFMSEELPLRRDELVELGLRVR